ncbi:M20/M25/M40 family metallo-hydrolase [Spongiivirga sp. MCCC 1A20706]|uniref:M20/M25/M40 family metallo-hydrolase n=1 Tax=Spongiivirga sp. MCCC 1A20706 TaxID=3160963 RepID=UPI003977D910
MKKIFLTFFLAITCLSYSQKALKKQIVPTINELKEFIAIPNDALEHSDIMRNIFWLEKQFKERGFNTAQLPTEGEPLFFANLPMKEGLPTLLFYMHFDGQAVDPSKWNQSNPYELVLRDGDTNLDWSTLENGIDNEWRLYGRSASDDKGPIVMFLNAIDVLKAEGKEIPFNIKVILDSEEEKGSKPLPKAVKQYKSLLKSDYLLISDGPIHPSGKPTLAYGCRGITTVTLTTYGPVKPQHSGHFGNYAPNPSFRMASLLSSMKDERGMVLIPGYYDGITLDELTKELLSSVPDDQSAILSRLSIKTAETVGANYQESLQYPSLNVRGINSGWTGSKARTIVPDRTIAEIDIRLVPESDGDRLKELVKKHIKSKGYFIVDKDPTQQERASHDKILKFESRGVTKPFRTDIDSPFSNWLQGVMKNTHGDELVRIRIMGGTVPISPFINELDIPAILVPIVNADNNQHSPNENIKVGMIEYGLKTFYGILTTPMN